MLMKKIMSSNVFTDDEKEIISKEYFIARLAEQPCYFTRSYFEFTRSGLLSNITSTVGVSKDIALLPDPLLDIVIDDE